MHIDGKQQCIGEQRKSANVGYYIVIMNKIIQKCFEAERWEFKFINNNKPYDGADKTEY